MKRFGLTMHVAPKGSTKSKTEAMFVPGHGRDERVPLCLESNYPIEAGTVISKWPKLTPIESDSRFTSSKFDLGRLWAGVSRM